MQWWKKALAATIMLLIVVAGVAFVLRQHNVTTPENAEIVAASNDKLGTLCGEITGAGAVIIWIVAYRGRRK